LWLRRRISFGSKARALLQPGERTHTHEDAEAEGTARAASRRAPFSPTPAPGPCLASCTPRKVRRAVWRTQHTQWVAPRSRRGRGGSAAARHACLGSGLNGTRFSSRHPAYPHSLTAAHVAHPAPHDTSGCSAPRKPILGSQSPTATSCPDSCWPRHWGNCPQHLLSAGEVARARGSTNRLGRTATLPTHSRCRFPDWLRS